MSLAKKFGCEASCERDISIIQLAFVLATTITVYHIRIDKKMNGLYLNLSYRSVQSV